MISLINMCLTHYDYIQDVNILHDNVNFYKKSDSEIASYFIINHIDCTSFETNDDKMKEALMKLELDYAGHLDNLNDVSLKQMIINSFTTTQEASQIDKNTSAIYLLKFNNILNFDIHRNLVYAIEESPNYFLRYVLPYTQHQSDSLFKDLSNHRDKKINEILSDIANNEDEYFKLMENKNTGSVYELVIRMFSKIPFLQYRFKADASLRSIDEDVIDSVRNDRLDKYHEAVKTGVCTLDGLLSLETSIAIEDKAVEKELNSLLGGVSSGI